MCTFMPFYVLNSGHQIPSYNPAILHYQLFQYYEENCEMSAADIARGVQVCQPSLFGYINWSHLSAYVREKVIKWKQL